MPGIPTKFTKFYQILYKSDKGFRFRACATSGTKLFTRLFLGVLHPITHSQDAITDVDAKYVKNAVPRKDVPFRGHKKTKFNIHTLSQKTRHSGAQFRRYLEIFARK